MSYHRVFLLVVVSPTGTLISFDEIFFTCILIVKISSLYVLISLFESFSLHLIHLLGLSSLFLFLSIRSVLLYFIFRNLLSFFYLFESNLNRLLNLFLLLGLAALYLLNLLTFLLNLISSI